MDVKKIAQLAHLDITDEEAAKYSPQMDVIVEYVEQLNELDTEGVEPMTGGLTEESLALPADRDDVPAASLSQESALSEAPMSDAGHFQVPKVL